MKHSFNIRVYYEDTDAGGVVYYANYLKFTERARTEMLRSNGIEQTELAEKDNMYFVVRKADIELFSSARLDDDLRIETTVTEVGGASVDLAQSIYRGDKELAKSNVKIVSVNKDFKPVRMNDTIKSVFSS